MCDDAVVITLEDVVYWPCSVATLLRIASHYTMIAVVNENLVPRLKRAGRPTSSVGVGCLTAWRGFFRASVCMCVRLGHLRREQCGHGLDTIR